MTPALMKAGRDRGSRARRLVVRGAALLGAGVLGLGLACIIPDRDIQVLTTDFNQYPIRFVEGIPLDEVARCACSPEVCECPMPELTALPTHLDPEDPAYQFCVCGDNKIDQGRLPPVSLFVEDQDEIDGEPADLIYAAALLDWDPTLGDSAFDYVAYRSYLDPRLPLDIYYSSYENGVIKRPRPYVRSMTFTDETERFDLCNGAGRPVGPGYHTLSIMVTDRPWFERESVTVGTDEGDGGEPIETMPATLDGVPDIAAGATYDIQTYVFYCYEEGEDSCDCMEVSDEG